VGAQRHFPGALRRGKRPSAHRTGKFDLNQQVTTTRTRQATRGRRITNNRSSKVREQRPQNYRACSNISRCFFFFVNNGKEKIGGGVGGGWGGGW